MNTHFDVANIRAEFPILKREVHPGVPLVYLDSAATSQKPLAVIQAMDNYYRSSNANIHRGIHVLAEEATAGVIDHDIKPAKFSHGLFDHVVHLLGNTHIGNHRH